MRALVTGANGLIGANLIRELLTAGHDVRAFVRTTSDTRSLSGLPVETVYGDILQPESISVAAKGCDVLFHAAAVFTYWSRAAKELEAIAVKGTLNAIEMAQRSGVRRVVLTSSSVVFGSSSRPAPRDESFQFREKDAPPYVIAKVAQDRAAFQRASALGVDLVAVCPTLTVGAYDYRLGPSNGVIVSYLKDPFKFTYPGGCNIVSARDVARGHILAAESGMSGERYILGSENLEYSTIHRAISELCGLPGPYFFTNQTGSYLAATAEEIVSWFMRRPPSTTRSQAGMVGRYYWYSHDRAALLGYLPKPARSALAEAISWLAASLHISRQLRATMSLSREIYDVRSMEHREAKPGVAR